MKQLVLAIGPLVIGFAGTGVLPVLAIDHGASHVIVAVLAWLVMFFIGSGLALLLFIPMRRWLPRASLVSWVCALLLIAVGLPALGSMVLLFLVSTAGRWGWPPVG